MGPISLRTGLERSSMGEDARAKLNSSNGIVGNTRGMCFTLIVYSTLRLTQVQKVVDALGLSFHTVKELNNKIDNNISGRLRFQCKKLTVNGEDLEFYSRDMIKSIQCLYGDP